MENFNNATKIVTSYLDSAARNMGFKEQLHVSVADAMRKVDDALTYTSMTRDTHRPRSTSKSSTNSSNPPGAMMPSHWTERRAYIPIPNACARSTTRGNISTFRAPISANRVRNAPLLSCKPVPRSKERYSLHRTLKQFCIRSCPGGL